MGAQLLCRTGELAGKTHEVKTETVIGRGDDADVLISSNLISARHASIKHDGRGYVLQDLGSANGTWLDGERVVRPVRLDRLNVITLAGVFDLIFHAESATPAPSPVPPPTQPAARAESPAPKPVAPPPVAPSQVAPPAVAPPTAAPSVAPDTSVGETMFMDDVFDVMPTLDRGAAASAPAAGGETVEVGGISEGVMALPPNFGDSTMHMDGPFDLPALEQHTESHSPLTAPVRYALVISGTGLNTQTVELTQRRRYTMGRAMECDISLDDEQVSRHHATIVVGDGVTVEDAGSSNGTHMDGRRLQAPVEIRPGASFTLGLSITVQLIER